MSKKVDVIGQRFGKLTVVEEVEPRITPSGRKFRMVLCKCDCGNTTVASIDHLRNGHTKSCGCYKSDWAKENVTKHGQAGSRLYQTYMHMKERCFKETSKSYPRYGGRGITVCDEWLGENGFQHFYDWAMNNGYKDSLTIDRINNDGNYEPSNCRWATQEQQMNNVSYNVHLTYNGETHTVAEWSKILGVNQDTIQARNKYYDMPIEEILFKPPTCKKKTEVFKDWQSVGVFDSQKEAAEFIGVHTSAITQCLKGKTKTANGYTFRRV